MSRFKQGDLVLNKWAGPNNPIKVSVFIKSGKTHTRCLALDRADKFFEVTYYTSDIEKQTDMFVNLGQTAAYALLKSELIKARTLPEVEG